MNAINKILEMKCTRKKFIMIVGTSIIALILLPKITFAKVFLRNSAGKFIDIDSWMNNGNVTRTDGYISAINLSDGITITISRDANNYITSESDGRYTWTVTRDVDGYIESWTIT